MIESHSEKLDLSSANIAEGQKDKLRQLFPEVFTERGGIDFDRLRLTLGESVDVGKERFGLIWPGKAECYKTIQRPSVGALLPVREESVDFERAENLFIEGDNLETLKLLQKAYIGKVKMIYIDPPYNTGSDFIYPDNFSESLQTYLEYTGQVDGEGKKLSTNTESEGRFHSKWLNMMYPRMFLARNLLRDDGVIFISIDDHEFDNLRKLCNEVFGEENFVATFIWQKRVSPDNDEKHVTATHDYVVCYMRSKTEHRIKGFDRSEEQDARYENPDNDPRGVWTSSDLTRREYREHDFYEIELPSGRKVTPAAGRSWSVPPSRFKELRADNRIWFGPNGDAMPRLKRFLTEVANRVVPVTWLPSSLSGDNQGGKRQIKAHFPELMDVFENPKPVELISTLIRMTTNDDDIVLDFFAGTGTTGEAVLQVNAAEGSNRKFILVQLPEPAERKQFKTIADITKERLRRALRRQQDSQGELLNLAEQSAGGNGFKVFRLASSNFRQWQSLSTEGDGALAKQLELHVDHVLPGRSQADILFEILLKTGFALTTTVQELEIAGKKVFSVAGGALLICLEKTLTAPAIQAMADLKPERVVCLDQGFEGNDQLKTNAVQTMKAKGVTSFRTV